MGEGEPHGNDRQRRHGTGQEEDKHRRWQTCEEEVDAEEDYQEVQERVEEAGLGARGG